MEVSGAVEAHHPRTVRSHHPFSANGHNGSNPVVLQTGSCGGVVRCHVTFLQHGKTAKCAGNKLVARYAERINMVVDQSVEGVHAARATGVEKGQAGGSRQSQAVTVGGHIGDVVGDEPVGASQHLLLAAGTVKSNQAVGGGNVHRACLGIKQDAVDAEHMLVFDMRCMCVIGRQNVQASVEVTNPKAASRVGCEGGNIAVPEDGGASLQHLLPFESVRIHAIKPVAGYGENGIAGGEQLAHFGQVRIGGLVSVRSTAFEWNRKHALIFCPDVELLASHEQRGSQHSRREYAGKASGAEDSYTEGRIDVSGVTGNGQ